MWYMVRERLANRESYYRKHLLWAYGPLAEITLRKTQPACVTQRFSCCWFWCGHRQSVLWCCFSGQECFFKAGGDNWKEEFFFHLNSFKNDRVVTFYSNLRNIFSWRQQINANPLIINIPQAQTLARKKGWRKEGGWKGDGEWRRRWKGRFP